MGLVGPALESLKTAGLDVLLFDDVAADPPEDKVIEAVNAARNHEADGVIGFGGGSSMDTAKGRCRACCSSRQTLHDILGMDQVTEKRSPLSSLPNHRRHGLGSHVDLSHHLE